MKTPRVVISGVGVAGSLIAAGLVERDDIELICLERVGREDHVDLGTGLNIGPNAIKALKLFLPESARRMQAASLPWTRWDVFLTDGTPLMRLSLEEVADCAGIRIRWSELYALLREPIKDRIRFGAEITACGRANGRIFVDFKDSVTGNEGRIEEIDLLIGADGRYSRVREFVLGPSEKPNFLGVCLYRLLIPAGPDCPIEDYGQWFNRANRLLAYRVPGDLIYCAGSFPMAPDSGIPETVKTANFLSNAYRPAGRAYSPEAGYLVNAIERRVTMIHWARLQDGSVAYGKEAGILLVGDSAHAMVPTLGQGATQACEDACTVVDEIRVALDDGRPLASVSAMVQRERAARVQFAVDFSREATDTMLAGADPVAGTKKKTLPPFQYKLRRLFRDVALPRDLRSS